MQTCLLMRVWDRTLDEQIVHQIESNEGKTHFYHLWKQLRVSRRTLNEHLKKLEEQEIIRKDENPQTGKKRYIRLTSKAILKKSLDILEGVKPNSVTMRHKKLLRLIIGMIGKSYTGHIRNDGTVIENVHLSPYLTTDLQTESPGISITDIENQNIYTGIVDDFSYEEITELINKLGETKITVPVLSRNGELRIRFDSSYEKLIQFITRCFHILYVLLINMKNKWFWLTKKPTSEEVNWFISIVGKKEMKLFFTSLKEERKLFPEKRKHNYQLMLPDRDANDLEKAIVEANRSDRESIKSERLWIKQQIEGLQNEYHEIGVEYPVFYELMQEVINPPFLQK